MLLLIASPANAIIIAKTHLLMLLFKLAEYIHINKKDQIMSEFQDELKKPREITIRIIIKK